MDKEKREKETSKFLFLQLNLSSKIRYHFCICPETEKV